MFDIHSAGEDLHTSEDVLSWLSNEYGVSFHSDENPEKELLDMINRKFIEHSNTRSIRQKVMKPLTARAKSPKIVGFDVETYGNKNKFYMGSIFGDGILEVFYDRDEMRDHIVQKKYRNTQIIATNLEFDLTRIFDYNDPRIQYVHRGSSLIGAKIKDSNRNIWTFCDSLSYAPFSVKKMGDIIGVPKLPTPEVGKNDNITHWIDPDDDDNITSLKEIRHWRKPNNEKERLELERYNIRDSEITYKFMRFLFDAWVSWNFRPKMTIASTAMDGFRRNFLYYDIYQMPIDAMLEMYEGYAGGRCETIKRGKIKSLKYFDFNSLYPSVMRDFEYPDPNTIKIYDRGQSLWDSIDGMSDVTISGGEGMHIPFLHMKTDTKLLFPVMKNYRGWYTNIELQAAHDMGYTIHETHKSITFSQTDDYFRNYVQTLYDKRLEYQAEESPLEICCKLLLNSLYGKFAQRFQKSDRWMSIDALDENTYEEFDIAELIDDTMIRVTKDNNRNAPIYTVPIWSIYCTAYARMKLFNAIKEAGERNVYYMDTDSLITSHEFDDSKRLGKMKLEFPVESGFLVRPKFYGLKAPGKDGIVKVKGLRQRIRFDDMESFMRNPRAILQKFGKFKESIRSGNDIAAVKVFEKTFKLDDTKRIWERSFSPHRLDESQPLDIEA